MDLKRIRLEIAKECRFKGLEALPDYGLRRLSTKMDSFCRRTCEMHGIDYAHMKETFLARIQVIPARQKSPIRSILVSKGVVPENIIDEAFLGWISGEVNFKIWKNKRQSLEKQESEPVESAHEARA